MHGYEAALHSVPWQVCISMQLSDKETFCGRSIFSLICSSHCVIDDDTYFNLKLCFKKNTVDLICTIFRIDELIEGDKLRFSVSSGQDKFSYNYLHDIVILNLFSSLIFNNFIQPICLPKQDNTFPKTSNQKLTSTLIVEKSLG
ncbi:Ovochymase-2 [Trichinella zimbabwensis]|uniref:Ovochymase-2 n=1 Tax=Trichinella zimbabwensis TaxID=268475 RepID=A0A0V1HL55_9BILA|nr:Ovochymase-2 [Trichinella zimbabwensis]